MKSSALCPVSDKRINAQIARINGSFTVLLLIVFGLTQNIIPVLILAVDFLLRATDYSKYSLIAISSRSIVSYLGLNASLVNAGPKIFAARLGFIFSTLIIMLLLVNNTLPALVFAGVLGLFSFLEAAFGLCVACTIYPLVYRLIYRVRL